MTTTSPEFRAVLGLFVPTRLHMRLTGTPEDYDPDAVSPRRASTLVHEYFHFLQTIFTGYGHIAWHSHRQATSFLVHEWLKILPTEEPKARLPLAHLAQVDISRTARAFIAHSTTLEMIRLGMARYALPDPAGTLEDLGLRFAPHPWPINPRIEVKGVERYLQGVNIVEGHAHFVESTYLARHFQVPLGETLDAPDVPDRYTIALAWFVGQVGRERIGEFPFVCDLALQSSWNPPVPNTESDWQQSNPSWRFVSLTKALYRHPGLAIASPTSWQSSYKDYAAALLASAGYLGLDDIIEERRQAFERGAALLGFEKLMRRGIEYREANPWCAGNPVDDDAVWAEIVRKFEAPIVEIAGQFRGGGLGTEESNAEVVLELQFQALAAQVFGDFSDTARRANELECAFSKYGISDGCEFQTSHNCLGRIDTAMGSPHPLMVGADGELSGCSFEMMMKGIGLRSTDINLNASARVPTEGDLRRLEGELRKRKMGLPASQVGDEEAAQQTDED